MTETPNEDTKLAGIGGWLILPAIGFVLGPILGVVGLIAALSLYSQVAAAGFGGLYTLELVVSFGLWIFVIYVATRFFRKKRDAPSTVIVLLSAGVVASAVLLAIEIGAGAEEFAALSGKQLLRGLITAAIWIPYFRVSKRVRATFVRD